MPPQCSDKVLPPLAVFWDIQNCHIPRGMSALAVCEKIRGEDFFQGHSEIQFAVVCDATKEPPAVLDDLYKAQVSPTENLRNAIIVHHCRENWIIQ
jgi:hypothetical protein